MTSILLRLEQPSPTMLLFNRSFKALIPKLNNAPIKYETDEDKHNKLQICQGKKMKSNDTLKTSSAIPVVSTIAIQHEDGGLWIHKIVTTLGNDNKHNR